ncbi:MAG: hypothetical protein ACYC3X_20910 [Pirellulaceae bacterium]
MIRSGPVWAWSALVMAAILGSVAARGDVQGQDDLPHHSRRASAAVDAPDTPHPNPEPTRQVREGSVLKDELGTFQILGDRVVFSPVDGRTPFPMLENLALERVWRMLEEVGNRQWRINGTVTEFRGRNFLMLDRAVVRVDSEHPAAKPKAIEPRS